ncbi:MAG: DUF255 domain-containing protein [Dehalobacterium sp.]|jgi:uncharacterized protein YyaL (SSP411 family)
MPHTINWLTWCPDTFQRAHVLNQPILMYLTAPWCHWCSIMDKTTFADHQVIRRMKDRFVPMKVNVDQYPHVADRYHFGGYPSVIILTGQGEVLQGDNYIPSREMISFLDAGYREFQCGNYHRDHGKNHSLQQRQGWEQEQGSSMGAPYPTLLEINHLISRSYDEQFGGFFIDGGKMKFPLPEICDYLLAFAQVRASTREKTMVQKTLDEMLRGGLYDGEKGGFFRYCEHQDWTGVHEEKLLESNAALLQCYLTALDHFEEKSYSIALVRTINFLVTDFFDEKTGLFGGSQRGGSVDKIPYTNWNSQMASALLQGGRILNYPPYVQMGLQLLDVLWRKCYRHDRGMSHFYLPDTDAPTLLSDQTKYILALLDGYQYREDKIYLKRAGVLMNLMAEYYRQPTGNFGDISNMEPKQGYLKIPLVPFIENIDVALLYLRMARLIKAESYKAKGEKILHNLGQRHYNNPIFVAKLGSGLLELEKYHAYQNQMDACVR